MNGTVGLPHAASVDIVPLLYVGERVRPIGGRLGQRLARGREPPVRRCQSASGDTPRKGFGARASNDHLPRTAPLAAAPGWSADRREGVAMWVEDLSGEQRGHPCRWSRTRRDSADARCATAPLIPTTTPHRTASPRDGTRRRRLEGPARRDVPTVACRVLRAGGIETSTAAELGLADDPIPICSPPQPQKAACCASRERLDFARLAAEHVTARTSPGVLTAPSPRFSRRPSGIARLAAAVVAIADERLQDRLIYLQQPHE